MEKICSAFSAGIYPCPTNDKERKQLLNDIDTRITELRTVLDKSFRRQCKLLADIYKYGLFWKGN